MSAARHVQLRYQDAPDSVSVRLIHTWDRACLPEETSAPTLRNQALAVFNAHPHIDRVVLVLAGALPLFLFRAGDAWFDVDAKQVVVAKESNA